MTFIAYAVRSLILFLLVAGRLDAQGLSADLDNPDQPLTPTIPSTFEVSLQNNTTYTLFITGVSIKLSDNATGEVYTSAFNQEGLNKLDAGQRWDGPLAKVTPHRRGPLGITGSIVLNGGVSTTVAAQLAAVPLRLWISDPKRDADGGLLRGALAQCDRAADSCCDAFEPNCIQRGGHCLYVAEGFDQQKVCLDGKADLRYEHVTELQASADFSHIVYRASSQCSTDGMEEHCRRVVVFDHIARPAPGVPGKVSLSTDGQHYAYRAYRACVSRLGEEFCDTPGPWIVDGHAQSKKPEWVPVDASLAKR